MSPADDPIDEAANLALETSLAKGVHVVRRRYHSAFVKKRQSV